MELKHKQSKPVAVMSMTFPSNDVNNFVVGSEDGSVYTASRHGRYVCLASFQFLNYIDRGVLYTVDNAGCSYV